MAQDPNYNWERKSCICFIPFHPEHIWKYPIKKHPEYSQEKTIPSKHHDQTIPWIMIKPSHQSIHDQIILQSVYISMSWPWRWIMSMKIPWIIIDPMDKKSFFVHTNYHPISTMDMSLMQWNPHEIPGNSHDEITGLKVISIPVGNNPVTGGNSHGNPMEITVEGEISHGNQWEIPSDWKSGNSQWEITGLKVKYRGKSQWSGKFPVGNLEGSQKSHLQVHPRGHKLGDLLWCLASQQRAQHLGVSLGFGKKNVGKNRVISPTMGSNRV